MRRAQGSSIQTIGALVLVVLVVVAIAVFFFSSLSKQGGVLASTSEKTVSGVDAKLDTNIACLPPADCCSADNPADPCCPDC